MEKFNDLQSSSGLSQKKDLLLHDNVKPCGAKVTKALDGNTASTNSGPISEKRLNTGRKTIVDARDLQALRQHCIKNRYGSVVEITASAQEHF